MAIIYTYPLKHKPVPADLVVITDSEDRNYTKQCSIQSIIDIIPGGGDGGCPLTYVIKPVSCLGTVCEVSVKLNEWIWTCDETLGALAPGFINEFKINDLVVPHPGGSTCWYIELATLNASTTTCDACCGGEESTYTYEKCDEIGVYVTVAIDPGDTIGKAYGYCCTDKDTYYDCWEYRGDIGRPVESGFTCDFGATYSNCDCCLYRCHYEYTKCPDSGGAAFPEKLIFDIGMEEEFCGCLPPDNDIIVNDGAGYNWCYSSPVAVCLAPTAGTYTITGTPDAPCDDFLFCPPDPEEENFRWAQCTEPYTEVITGENPLQPIGFTNRFCCEGEPSTEFCYQYMGTTLDPISGSFPCVLQIDDYIDCNCCVNHCNYNYAACPGKPEAFPESTIINMGLIDLECGCDAPYPSIVIEIDGVTWCYENPEATCDDAGPYEVFQEDIPCGDPAYCPTPNTQYRWKLCEDEVYSYTDSDTDPWLLTIGVFPFYGTLQDAVNCETEMCCIEIDEFAHAEPITSISTACTISSLTAYDDCQCCVERNIAKYEVCATGGASCEGYGPYYLDTCVEWGVLIDDAIVPDFLQFEVVTEEYCCFEKVPNDTCEPASGAPAYVEDPSFVDCNCGEAVYRYKICDGEVWIYTNTQDLSAAVGSTISTGEDCYDVESTGTLIGPDTPLGSYDPAGFLYIDCECCDNPRIKYLLCAEQDASCGTAGVTSVVVADTWGSLGAAPNNILLDLGESCCYEQDDYTCDPLTSPPPVFTNHPDCDCAL